MSRIGVHLRCFALAFSLMTGAGAGVVRGGDLTPGIDAAGQTAGTIYQRFLKTHYSRVRPAAAESAIQTFNVQAPLSILSLEISADTSSGRFRQDEPVVGRFDSGTYLVFWRDPRNGRDELFSRPFDASLASLGSASPLFSDAVDRSPGEITADCDGQTMMVGWVDGTAPHFAAAFTDSAGTVTAQVVVDVEIAAQFVGSPDVARLYPGGFISVWEEFRLGGWRIFSQRFSSGATPVLTNSSIAVGADSLLKFSPAAVGDTAGGYIIAWSEGDASRCDVHVRVFDFSGMAVSTELTITSPTGNESYILPDVVYVDSVDEFWVTYVRTDDPADSTALFLQRIALTGTALGTALAIDAGPYPWSPQISSLGADVAIHTERFDNLGEIRTLRLSPQIAMLDPTEVINAALVRERGMVSSTSSGDTLCVVWSDRESGKFDIHGRLRTAGVNASADLILSTSIPGGQQSDASIASRDGGGVLAVFTDTQLDDGDISLVDIAEDGSIVLRRLANDDGTLAAQYGARIAADASGRNLITWTDERTDWTGPARHAAGRFMQSGAFQGPVVKIAEDSSAVGSSQTDTDVSMNADGRSAVVWIDTRSGTARAYMRRFESNNSASTGDLLLDDGGLVQITVLQELTPAVSVDTAGRVWTAWSVLDDVTDSFFVLAQAWDAAGNRRGLTLNLTPMGKTAAAVEFDILAAANGTLRLIWYDPSSLSIRRQTYDTAGVALDLVQRVSDSGVVASSPTLAHDLRSDQWCIGWTEQSGSYRNVLWRRHNGNGIPVAPVEQISSSTEVATVRSGSALAYGGTYLYGAWHDNESAGEGLNVRLSSMLKTAASVSEENTIRPDQISLFANFPNPFNPRTMIRFVLDHPSHVRLEIIDVLGRRVRQLALGARGAGTYDYAWDGTDDSGRDLASGVYFYRLNTGTTTRTRKMLLLR